MKNRLKYIDNLKFIAILGVIGIHTFYLVSNVEIIHIKMSCLTEIFRFAVPIFLMASGALLLNREINIEDYIKKRFIRIILPLIFFLILICILQVYSYNHPLTRFWYAWMIIGTYLSIPIINKFVQYAKKNEIEYYLIIFILASIIYELSSIFNINHALDLNLFIGPISFLVLGYYLSKREFNISANKIVIITLFIFIISTIIKIKFVHGQFYPTSPKTITTFLDFSIFEIIQASSLFLLIKNLYQTKGILKISKTILENNIINKFINSISRASYGMYLLHMIIIRGYLPNLISNLKFSGTITLIFVIMLIILQTILTWIIVWILGQIPYINKISGYY